MPYRAQLRCIGCGAEKPLDTRIFRCGSCGELFDVEHDMAALRKRSASGWMKLFESRAMSTDWPYGSGVWGKKEWVAPHVDDDNVVSMFEGSTNLFWAERLGKQLGVPDLWVKQCGNSHTGSFKDLGMTVLISTVKQMISDGQEVVAVGCASTGDTSAALSAYAAAAGIRSVVVLPKGKISTAQLVQPLANGATVLAIESDFDGCMRLITELSEKDGLYLANSMNPLRLEGQKTVAIEMVQQFNWEIPDWVIIPGGNLGNVSALGAGFEMMIELGLITKRPRICVAQAQHANPLYRSFKDAFQSFESIEAKTTLASAIQIGNPVSRRKAVRALQACDGVVEEASEQELANAAGRADRTGMFCCPHTGVALAALEKLIASRQVEPQHRVIVISTAHGLKFGDFKRGYHDNQLANVHDAPYANQPIDLPEDYDKVRAALLRSIDS